MGGTTPKSLLKSLSSTDTFGSKLSIKSCNVFRLFVENNNVLNITNLAWKYSHKCCRLKKLWIKCEVDLIRLVETQSNTELLARRNCVKENLFRSCVDNTIFTNNENEFTDVIQQGRVLSSVRV